MSGAWVFPIEARLSFNINNINIGNSFMYINRIIHFDNRNVILTLIADLRNERSHKRRTLT